MNNYFSLCSFLILFASSCVFDSAHAGIFYSSKICFKIPRITYYDLSANGVTFLKICSIPEINYEINGQKLNKSPYTNCFYCQNSIIYNYTISVYMYNYDESCILPYPIFSDNNTFYTNSQNLRSGIITENIKDIDWINTDSYLNRTENLPIVGIQSYAKHYHSTIYLKNPFHRNPIEKRTSLSLGSSNYESTTMNPDYNDSSLLLTNSMNGFDRTTSNFQQKTAKNRYIVRFPPRRYNNGYNYRFNYGYESRFGNINSWRNQFYTTMGPWRWNQHKRFTSTHYYNERKMTTPPRRYNHGYFNKYNNRYNDRYNYRYESRFGNRNSWRNQFYTTMHPWRWNQHKRFTSTHYYIKRKMTTPPRRYNHGYFNKYNNRYNDRYNYRYESRFRNRNSWRNQFYTTLHPWRWNQHKRFTSTHYYNKRKMTTPPRRYNHGYFNKYNNRYNDRYNYRYESRFGNINSWRNQFYTTMHPWRWNQHKRFTSAHHYNVRKMTILHENRRRGMNSNNYQYKYHKLYDQKKNEYFSSYFAKYPYFNRHDFFWLSIGFFIFGLCSLAIIGTLIVKILSDKNKMEVILKNKRSTLNGIVNPSVELDVLPPRYDELNSNSNVIHNV